MNQFKDLVVNAQTLMNKLDEFDNEIQSFEEPYLTENFNLLQKLR